MSREESLEKFASSVMGSGRAFRWPWETARTLQYMAGLRKTAQDADLPMVGAARRVDAKTDEANNEDIIRGLLQVHQDQQANVAAAENEARSVRQEMDSAKQQLLQLQQQLQAVQGQSQQVQQQAQMRIQQAQQQLTQMQQAVGPQIQQAKQETVNAQQETTKSKMELADANSRLEQIRQGVMTWKSQFAQLMSQDPVTMEEAKREAEKMMQQRQQEVAMQQQQQMQQQMEMQAQTQQGGRQNQNPMDQIARMAAGQGARGNVRGAMANQYLQGMAQQGAQQGMGGMQVPGNSPAGMAMKQASAFEKAANHVVNQLRVMQGGTATPPDGTVLPFVLADMGVKIGQAPGGQQDPRPDWVRLYNQSPDDVMDFSGGEINPYNTDFTRPNAAWQRGEGTWVAPQEMAEQNAVSTRAQPPVVDPTKLAQFGLSPETVAAIAGGGLGAAAGGLAGYGLSSENRGRKALLGATLGGAGGAGLGYHFGGDVVRKMQGSDKPASRPASGPSKPAQTPKTTSTSKPAPAGPNPTPSSGPKPAPTGPKTPPSVKTPEVPKGSAQAPKPPAPGPKAPVSAKPEAQGPKPQKPMTGRDAAMIATRGRDAAQPGIQQVQNLLDRARNSGSVWDALRVQRAPEAPPTPSPEGRFEEILRRYGTPRARSIPEGQARGALAELYRRPEPDRAPDWGRMVEQYGRPRSTGGTTGTSDAEQRVRQILSDAARRGTIQQRYGLRFAD